MMKTRLEVWEQRLLRNSVNFEGYNGPCEDVYTWLKHTEDTMQEIITCRVACHEQARILEAKSIEGGASNTKMIKTTPSTFPKFDGVGDYEIWETNWNKLALNSQLNKDCLLIKLRESLVGHAAEYIGKTGMAVLTYEQV